MTGFRDPGGEPCALNAQAVGWVLHALEPDEEMAVLLHLPHCLSCRDAVTGAEQVLSGLGASVEQVEPPPSLRESLMARVANTQQGAPAYPVRPPAETPRPAPAPASPRHRAADEPVPFQRRPRGAAGSGPSRGSRFSRGTRRVVTAAVALLAVVAVGGLGIRTAQLQQERNDAAAQAQAVTDLVQELGQPGTRYAFLTEPNGPTVAAVVISNGQRQVVPVGLPANATDRDIYVLWGTGAGPNPQPLGTFDVTDTGVARLTVGSGAADAFSAYAVSIEPGRAAPTRPTTVVASGAVTA